MCISVCCGYSWCVSVLLEYGSLHLVYAWDYGYVAHDGLQFGKGVDRECDGTRHDGIFRDSVEIVDGEVEVVGYAVDQVDEQVVAIDGSDIDGDRIESLVRFEVDRHNVVALLRSEPYGYRTVAFMESDGAIGIFESHHFLARHRITVGTSVIGGLGLLLEILCDGLSGLVGHGCVEPVGGGVNLRVSEYLHNIAAVETCLD